MEVLVFLDIKSETFTYEGREIKVLNAYTDDDLLIEGGITVVPFTERALSVLAEDEIFSGTQALDVQITLPYTVTEDIKNGIVAKFTADPIFNSITFKN